MYRLRIGMALGVAAMACSAVLSGAQTLLAAQASLAQAEHDLREYLRNRILVFRETGLNGSHLKFDFRGRVREVEGDPFDNPPPAILFWSFEADEERLVVRGEPIWLELKNDKRDYIQDQKTLRFVNCEILLNEGVQPTLDGLKAVLVKIFLTRDELEERINSAGTER